MLVRTLAIAVPAIAVLAIASFAIVSFAFELRVIALRASEGRRSTFFPAGNTTVIDVAALDDLERLLRPAGAQ